jgi:sigma-B regulation protein RsbU (phosphoserine phosphatase)
MTHQTDTIHTMECTEIWGGNAAVDRTVVTVGLDAWVYSRPYEGDQEGGDIHYLSACSTWRITRLLIADVSGHGRVVADMAQRLKLLMRRYMNYINQSRLVEGLNREFGGLAKEGHFATAVVATYWSPTREIEITNAGHPPPLVFRAATGQWGRLTFDAPRRVGDGPSDLPLGIIDVATYERSRVRLSPADKLLFYTDALIESKDSNGRLVGVDGLVELLNQLGAASPQTVIPSLLERLGAGPKGEPLGDDTTLLLLQLNERAVRSCVLEGCRATGRVLSEFVRSFKPGSGPMPWPEFNWANLAGIWEGRWNRWKS